MQKSINTIGSSTYVASRLIVAFNHGHYNPMIPNPVSVMLTMVTPALQQLSGANISGSSTYALVAANRDNGVQIIDITDPYHPDPVSELPMVQSIPN